MKTSCVWGCAARFTAKGIGVVSISCGWGDYSEWTLCHQK